MFEQKPNLITKASMGLQRLPMFLSVVILSAILIATTQAQSTFTTPGSIRGSIQSPTGIPVSGINVTLHGTALGATTDGQGEFRLRNIPTGTYTLVAIGVGYSASKQNITVMPGKATILTMQIDESTHSLQEVLVAGLREQSYVEPVVESGTRTRTPLQDIPQAIQVIPRQVLQEQQVYRLSDAFRNVAGITDQSGLNWVVTLAEIFKLRKECK